MDECKPLPDGRGAALPAATARHHRHRPQPQRAVWHAAQQGGYALLFPHCKKCLYPPMHHYSLPDCLLIVYRCTRPQPQRAVRHAAQQGLPAGTYRSPRHRMQFSLPQQNEGSKCVGRRGEPYLTETRVQSALDDVASHIRQALPRHRVSFNSRDEGSKCVGRRGEPYPPGPATS